jgi:hypothetical protein
VRASFFSTGSRFCTGATGEGGGAAATDGERLARSGSGAAGAPPEPEGGLARTSSPLEPARRASAASRRERSRDHSLACSRCCR